MPRALNDIDEIITYISSESLKCARKFFDELENGLNNLESFPLMGRQPTISSIKNLGYRVLSIGEFEVFYKIEDYEILISRVFHSARDYPEILNN